MRLLELAQGAGRLFRQQSGAEQRRLLGFVLSNCSWRDGHLTTASRQPVDLLAKNVIAIEEGLRGRSPKKRQFDNWLPFVDSYRTFCLAPPAEIRELFTSLFVSRTRA